MQNKTYRRISPPLIRSSLAALGLLFAASNSAYAGEWYAGMGLGRSTANDFKDTAHFSGSVGKSDTSKEIFGGFQFHKYGAVEVAYVDLGKVTFDGQWDGVDDSGTLKTTGMKASVIGMLPFGNPWRIFGKVGMFKWKVEEDELYAGVKESSKSSGTDPVYGVGIQVDVHKYFDVRAEWERHDRLGDNNGHTDTYSAKLIWKFL